MLKKQIKNTRYSAILAVYGDGCGYSWYIVSDEVKPDGFGVVLARGGIRYSEYGAAVAAGSECFNKMSADGRI